MVIVGQDATRNDDILRTQLAKVEFSFDNSQSKPIMHKAKVI